MAATRLSSRGSESPGYPVSRSAHRQVPATAAPL